jgi:glycosyltransferase involved in cell wall biosynthesis
VGTVAALVGHKDYPNLLQAAEIVIRENPEITFMAVGDGKDENLILALAKKLELGERFIFAGYQKNVGEFLKSFDIFVLASHMEGLGTSILDAQALGLPVVACRCGGIPEAVYDKINGRLVAPKNSEELASAILELATRPDLRQAYGKKARETVREFDISQTVKRNLNLYQSLLS